MPSVGPGVDLRKLSQLDRRGPFILGLTGPSRFVLDQYFESQQSVLILLWPEGATGINVYWPNSKFTGHRPVVKWTHVGPIYIGLSNISIGDPWVLMVLTALI